MLALDCCTGESLENDDLILIGALEDEFIWFISAKVQGGWYSGGHVPYGSDVDGYGMYIVSF